MGTTDLLSTLIVQTRQQEESLDNSEPILHIQASTVEAPTDCHAVEITQHTAFLSTQVRDGSLQVLTIHGQVLYIENDKRPSKQ